MHFSFFTHYNLLEKIILKSLIRVARIDLLNPEKLTVFLEWIAMEPSHLHKIEQNRKSFIPLHFQILPETEFIHTRIAVGEWGKGDTLDRLNSVCDILTFCRSISYLAVFVVWMFTWVGDDEAGK